MQELTKLLMWILSALPIALLLILMTKYHLTVSKAAGISLVVAITSGLTVFKSTGTVIFQESLKGIWNSAAIISVIFPALMIYELTDEIGAIEIFSQTIEKIVPNKLLQILAVGWVFISFLQGITGFGVPIAIVVPLLVSLGVYPLWALLISLFGHAWAGTFGTLAMAFDALLFQTGISSVENMKLVAFWSSIYLWIFNFISGLVICWIYGKSDGLKKGLPAVIAISIVHGGGQLIFSQINQTIACFLSTCIALVVVVFISRMKFYRKDFNISSKIIDKNKKNDVDNIKYKVSVNESFLPYYLLITITLLVLLVPQIKNTLSVWQVGLDVNKFKIVFCYNYDNIPVYSPISFLVHPGTILFVSVILSFIYFGTKGNISFKTIKNIIVKSLKKTIPSGISIVLLIILSKILGGTNQILVLSNGIGKVMGKFYVLISPLVGILGSFITGSNMSSNILFGEFQFQMAKFLSVNSSAILGLQTTGGSIGNTISPSSIILGTTTAGISGEEGMVIKKMIPYTLVFGVIIGVLSFVLLT